MTTPAIRALSLLSGGLDSQLAVCVLREQGLEVAAVTFESPFFSADNARRAARQLDLPLQVIDFTDDIVALVRHPPHGFGAGLNPCIDCHARMLQRAGRLMQEQGFSFLSTGEVLNERPMSQTRASLATVARDSGFGEWILRPLSARRLPETRPEQLGWVDRSRLLALEGRSRRPQIELAARYGLRDYPTPAGGCLLTEPNFCRRLLDLRSHEGLDDARALRRLGLGRHFRLEPRVKLIVGRNREDNEALRAAAGPEDLVLSFQQTAGPTALLSARCSEETLRLAAAVCARYCDAPPGADVAVSATCGGHTRTLRVQALPREQVERLLV